MVDATAAGTRTAATLGRLGAATLGESGGRPLDRALRPVWPGAAVAAPCFAVQCAAGDNLAVHVAVAAAPPGHVLAVEVPGDREHGFWGEVLTVAAQSRHLAGLIIDACTRDTDALEARRFAVFSLGIALPGAAKTGHGTVGGSATVGGVTVETGDWLVADVDGIVAIAAADVEAVLEAGEAREAKEATMFDAMSAGATTIELLGLDTGPITRHD
jgi:4-hydroxy-4-methyl-2-oxoglutarate aldolase